MASSPKCADARKLMAVYTEANVAFEQADRFLVMKSNAHDPIYLEAWTARKKAEKVVQDTLKAYRRHLGGR
jgi:hypothetical protein